MNSNSRDTVYKIFTEEMTGDGLLGTKRTLAEYGTFAGLDFTTGEVIDNC
jgi:hypothetical protein